MSPSSLLRLSSVLLLLLPHFARAQDLADVLSSIQERKRAVEQAAQMYAHLQSLEGVNLAIPDQQLIKWEGLTGVDFPAAGSFASKGIEGQVALLNQAIMEFRKLSGNYMNLRPEDLTANAKIGAIRPYLKEDFPELGRADASNYQALVSELAQDVVRLRVHAWPFAGKKRTMYYSINKRERPEEDENGHVTLIEEYAEGSQTCSGWAPTSLGGGSVDTGESGSWRTSGIYAFAAALTEEVSVAANFHSVFHPNESEPQNSYTLRTLDIKKSATYHSDAALFAAVPGRMNDQLGGKVVLLATNSWSPATAGAVTAPETWNHADATYWVVKAETDSTAPTSLGAGPGITVKVAWFDRAGSIPEDLSKMALPAGFDEMQSNYAGTYIERSWQNQFVINTGARVLERKLYALCVPDFKKGLNSGAKAGFLAQSAMKFRPPSGDAAPLLHPVPGLLAGVPLGVGIGGNSPGWIGISPGDFGFHGVDADFGYSYASSGIIYPDAVHNRARVIRFDHASNLRFVGPAQDFHVVYATERSLAKRGADLPALAPTSSENTASGWMGQFFTAWDMPRLRQVVSRDFLVDITPQGHFKNEVKIYRRPLSAGAVNRTPGHLETPDSAQLVRTLVFSNPDAPTTAYPAAAAPEKVHIADGTTLYEVWKDAMDTWYPYKIHPLHFKMTKGTKEYFSKVIEFPEGLAAKITTKVDGAEVSVDEIADTGWWLSPWNWWDDQSPASVVRTAATKTTTITNTLIDEPDDPTVGSQEGRYPDATTIDYPDLPQLSLEWKVGGVIDTVSQGPWSTTVTTEGGALKAATKLGGSLVGTTWTEWSESGRKVKTSSASDGTATSVVWSETEYGDTSGIGLPGLPHMVKNSDGTGATYEWGWLAPSNTDQLTLTEGLVSGSTISSGTQIVRNTNERGHSTGADVFLILSGTLQTGGSVLSAPTAWGMPTTSTDYNTGLASTWTYDGKLSRITGSTSGLGVSSTLTSYDALDRPGSVTTNGITAVTTFPGGYSSTTAISGNATGSITDTRDALGRLTYASTTWNGVTDFANLNRDTAGTLKITGSHTLFGAHRDDFNTGDGSLSLSKGDSRPFGGADGTTVVVDGGLLKTTSRLLKSNGSPTDTFTTTWTDAWGRVRKVSTPPASGSNPVDTSIVYEPLDHSASNSKPQRDIVTDKTGRVTLTETDPVSSSGILRRSGIDVNGNGSLGASDRYVESLTSVSGTTDIVTILSLTEDSGLREILRNTWTPDGNKTVTIINGGEETITRTPNYGTKTVKTESRHGNHLRWEKNETFNNLGLTTSSTLSGTGVPAATLTPVWRDDGSLSGVTFTTGGDTHSATFKDDGTLLTLNAPGKGNILGGHSISGGVETLTIDGTTKVSRLDGTRETTSGGDALGKTEELSIPTTGPAFNRATTPDFGAATNVSLNAAGAPTAKNYAAGTGEGYTHTPGGLLSSITLARGGSLAFGYSPDGAKDLQSATWPQVTSGSPVVFTIPGLVQGYTYDRAARIKTLTDASGSRTLGYDRGRLANTVWNSGPLAGYKVVKGLDNQGRDTGFELWRGNTMIHAAAKTFTGVNSESDEIFSVTASGFSAILGRNGARSLESVTRGTVTQTWERGTAGRILSASSNISGAPSFNYKGTANNEATAFDAKGRRLKCATAGGEWVYQYTNGRLTSAVHPALGSFSYGFDGIGRRTDMGSANTSDLLNRTLAWTHSQNKILKVNAHPDARVWVGIGTGLPTEIPSFTGAYSYPVTPPGTSGGWVAWNTLAVLEGEGDAGANLDAKAQQTGAIWVPPVNESFTFDAAGNRESSALWDYGWDAKNNLVRSRTKNHAAAAQGYDISNAYDAENRRFSKKAKRYQNGGIAEENHITFIHDGNDIVYERHQLPSGLTTCERKYIWGPDLSGTQGGAGGAGGLLLIRETKGNSTIDLYPLYDGSGNVIALADNTGTLKAEYGYTPFGEPLYARGPNAQSCPFRFATKYYDQETGLCNFGERFYDPVTCQWTSREPLGERESLNLYDYGHGDPVNNVDVQGLEAVAIDAAVNNGIPTMIYEEWAGSGLAYLWNAMAAGNVKTWNQAPDEGQLKRCFYFEDGAWHLRSPEARRNAFIDESIAQIPAKMEEVGPWLEMCEKGGCIAAVAPFAALAAVETAPAWIPALYSAAYTVGTNPLAYSAASGAVTTGLLLLDGESPENAVAAGVLDGGMTRISAGPINWSALSPANLGVLNPAYYRMPLGQMNMGVPFPKYVGPSRAPVDYSVGSPSLNTTRTGVIRTNPTDWRNTRDLWDELGYGEILSISNRIAISKGRTPTVDEIWISFNPEDAGLLGERISMHHVLGLPITVPLPATRHLDAHMPGGFRYNPGGTGSQLPIYPRIKK